jgi:nitrate/nitrite-specific signal transduction histidine kinase
VADDGVGFDPSKVGDEHHGLALMRQRVALAHGEFTIDAAPGRGSVVEIRLPTVRPQTPPPAPADNATTPGYAVTR